MLKIRIFGGFVYDFIRRYDKKAKHNFISKINDLYFSMKFPEPKIQILNGI